MISRKDLERLAALESEHGIVSVYIGIEPRLRFAPDQHVMKYKGAVKRLLREQPDARTKEVIEREDEGIAKFLEEHGPRRQALCVFTSQPDSIWETIELDVRVPTMVHVDTTTNTTILARVLDEYPSYVVVVIQRDRAQILIAEQRSSTEATEIDSAPAGQHSTGGWSQARFERHIDTHVDRHFESVLAELQQLYYERPFSRLAVGGTHENVTDFVGRLPEPMRKHVIGTFQVNFKIGSEEELLERAREVMRDCEIQKERKLLEEIVDAAEAGAQGAVGLDDVLKALAAGQVDRLIVADGMTKGGSECLACGALTGTVEPVCPVCRVEIEPGYSDIDVINRAVERALLTGASIDTIANPEELGRLVARGGIAARLRY